MNDEQKSLWKETYNKKVETMSVQEAASEADDVVSEWSKRNIFSDQTGPLLVCPKVYTHHHIRMESTETNASSVNLGQYIQFNDYEPVRGEVSRIFQRGTISDQRTIFEVTISRVDPPVGIAGHVYDRYTHDRLFSATVV